MARPRSYHKCAACNSTETYVDKRGWSSWRTHDDDWYCMSCYKKYIKMRYTTTKRDIERSKVERTTRISFKNKRLYTSQVNIRKGVCEWCGAVKGIDCKRTSLHHWFYLVIIPWACTVEICNKCHRKEHITV